MILLGNMVPEQVPTARSDRDGPHRRYPTVQPTSNKLRRRKSAKQLTGFGLTAAARLDEGKSRVLKTFDPTVAETPTPPHWRLKRSLACFEKRKGAVRKERWAAEQRAQELLLAARKSKARSRRPNSASVPSTRKWWPQSPISAARPSSMFPMRSATMRRRGRKPARREPA
jgi:hypothetical protein